MDHPPTEFPFLRVLGGDHLLASHDHRTDRHFPCRQAIAGNVERKTDRVLRADQSMITA